jgi:hypothetical protein
MTHRATEADELGIENSVLEADELGIESWVL